MNTVLLIGAGKSATVLIDYLVAAASKGKWQVIIADANREQVLSKTGNSPYAEAVALDVTDDEARAGLIQKSTLVISMMPPALHFLVAKDCLAFGKHLLTASYLDEKIKAMDQAIREKGLLFLCEMGLDPGIDHMSAMQLIEHIQSEGGLIHSFKSHCGGLVAPESDNNPWHYKISWNPRNVVLAGKAGAEYKLNGSLVHKDYTTLFSNCEQVNVAGLSPLAWYPNRDSLSYMPLYHLENARTFIRTTLRYPDYCKGWQAIVDAGLADDSKVIDVSGLTYNKWSAAIQPFITDENKSMLAWLGLFENNTVPSTAKTSADILQHLLETKMIMHAADKDMIVMLHEIEYTLKGKTYKTDSSLVVKGEDNLRTAMAKTVGLPLGIAAAMILDGIIQLTGVHIPVTKEIYEPVLKELAAHSISFREKISAE